MRSHRGLCLLLVTLGCSSSSSTSEPTVDVGVTPEPTGTLDPMYAGYAFDTAQLTGGMWWSPGASERAPAPTPDLESSRLRALTALLSPAVLRVGGTDCNAYYFCPESGDCEPPDAYRGVFRNTLRTATVMTHEDVRRVAAFAEAVDAQILMCVNVGPGPRAPDSGVWQTENARALMRFVAGLPQRDRFSLWEPGNEVNTLSLVFENVSVDADSFSNDLETFVALLDEEMPGVRVAAPGSFILPFGEVPDLTSSLLAVLKDRPEARLDIVSWHLYATQSTACSLPFDEATPENLLSDDIMRNHRVIANGIHAVADGRPVWNTESASAQCGGQENVSDVMVDALWYMDWYGTLITEGTELIVRHSLVGADYSLLDAETFTPRPTFWALALMRHTAERARLTTTRGLRALRAHAYCAPEALGDVTVVLINRSEDSLVANIELDGGVQSARSWLVSADGDLRARAITINGTVPDAALPDARAVRVSGGAAMVEMGPYDLAFVVLSGGAGRPEACL